MRKVTYGGACSLDGFIVGPDGALDWLHHSKDVTEIMRDYWGRIDTLVMGRKTYEAALAMGGGGDGGGMMKGITSYVFSRTLKALPKPGAILVSEDAGEFVWKLKQAEGKEICVFGGGVLAGALFAAGVIDEVGFNVHPVLLGGGIPAVRQPGRVKLKLTEARPIAGGCVFLNYRVVTESAARS